MIYYIATFGTAATAFLYLRKKNNIPYYDNWYPIIGNAMSLLDTERLIKFGDKHPVFQIQVFAKNIAFICDEKIMENYFKQKETQMSLYDALRNLYFGNAFSDKEDMFPGMIHILRKSIQMQTELFVPKIIEESINTVKRVQIGQPQTIADLALRFVADTSASCFIGRPLGDELFNKLKEFSHYLNELVIRTYLMPKWIITMLWGPTLRQKRIVVRDAFADIVGRHIDDPKLKESLIIRNSVDYYSAQGSSRQNIIEYTCDILVCLLYVSSENTALGVANALVDIIKNDYWDRVQSESTDIIQKQDYNKIFTNELIDNIVWESARHNTHIIPLNRVPKEITKLGKYDFTGIDTVAICAPYIMKYGRNAHNKFPDPFAFNLNRFNDDGSKLKSIKNIITWGFGVHTCPGRMFAIYEIKACLAFLTSHFNKPIIEHISDINLFSTSAYGSRNATIRINSKNELNYEAVTSEEIKLDALGCNLSAMVYKPLPDVWHIKNALTHESIESLFDIINVMPEPTSSGNRVLLGYVNLVYTGESNMMMPDQLVKTIKHITKEVGAPIMTPNSLYSMSMRVGMAAHKDKYVDWGISISIGSACKFTIGTQSLVLENGDILIADFSKYEHSVDKIFDSSMPEWFAHKKNYDMTRCSIQIREINKFPEPISHEEFMKLI